MLKHLKIKIGVGMIAIMVALAVLAPIFPIHSPNQTNIAEGLKGPSPSHLLGQDDQGRDVLSRLLYGARLSLFVGVAVVILAMLLGVFLGLLAGYFGRFWDQLFIFVSDIFLAFPSILLIIAVAAFVPPSVFNIILVLSIVGWVSYARLVRGQVLGLKEIEYVQAARSLGYGHGRILIRHLLPNILAPIIVNATFSLAGVIIAESTLSFLGLGLPAHIPSWGGMLDTGVAYLLVAPHISIVTGFAIMWTVMGFNFLGDGLRDYYAVK